MRYRRESISRPNLDTLDIPLILQHLGVRFQPAFNRGWITCWCVFHADGEHPNLRVRSDSGGTFHCFSCGEKGNILHIIEHVLRCSREEAWSWLEGRGSFGSSASSVLRALQKRGEAVRETLMDQAEAVIDGLYGLLWISPARMRLMQEAARAQDVRYFRLVDPDWYLLCDMVDYIYIYTYRDGIYPRLQAGDRTALDELREEAAGVWRLALRTGYLERHPLQFRETVEARLRAAYYNREMLPELRAILQERSSAEIVRAATCLLSSEKTIRAQGIKVPAWAA